ncbi:M20 aminoacylase family protein [Falsihalocynthiibacter sp. S25ZX9]|uniref:M20 aminoacylase family protein n=1 Tax=Falsihalocynthiibacter sp. S25ZX9 TaxID=3240870 RepID=UPI0035108C9C
MAVINRIGDLSAEMTTWRRALHENPELGFECHETAAFVAQKLREFGVDSIEEGIAKTGIVAIINGQKPGPTIGLRADMDALPMQEESGVEYASKNDGKMHACGHDGHTTMLLGAAKYLVETRNFSGRVALLFQPAEEGGGGGEVMCQEGVMDRFDIQEVYAIHNAPEVPVGKFETCVGPNMAAVDSFDIFIKGTGGHAAMPHETADPIMTAVALAQGIQSIVSRNHKATDDLVVSVTQIHAGTADNIIPDTAYINGTVRTFAKDVQAMVMKRLEELCSGYSSAYGVHAKLVYHKGYPATINHAAQTAKAAEVARSIVGEANVDAEASRIMAAEDFAYMLEERPGAYLHLGQGMGAQVHHPAYVFNDEILPIGASFFARMVENSQPLT